MNHQHTLSSPPAPPPKPEKNYEPPTSQRRKAWATYKLVLAITRDQFAAAIDDVYYAVLDDPTEGLNGVDLRTLVQHILTTYAQISQPDLDDNITEFNTRIDPGLPLAVYTCKQEKCRRPGGGRGQCGC
jgi:hypothetical protein